MATNAGAVIIVQRRPDRFFGSRTQWAAVGMLPGGPSTPAVREMCQRKRLARSVSRLDNSPSI